MSTLILHRFPLEPFPYAEWLADHPGDLLVVAGRDRIEGAGERVPDGPLGCTRLEVIDTLDDTALLERTARRLIEEHAVRHVVTLHEADQLRAARLRAQYGLPGALPADVVPFRDKALMKRWASAAGLAVAPHAIPRDAVAAREFAEVHGFPVVLKDRAGFSSIGLRIVRDGPALDAALAAAFGAGPRDDLLIEAFVPGRMCHVDGLVAGGATVLAWPSQYQYDLASFGSDPGARVDLTLDPADPLTPRLLDFTERALAALRPAGSRLTDHAFHAEIFHTPDDRLVLCEIACRPAGAKIREVFQAIFGIDHAAYAVRAQLGLPLPLLDGTGPLPVPSRMAGQVLMMKRPGRISAVPEAPGEDWVERFWLYGRPGETVPPAAGSSDFLLAAVGTGPDRAVCERRLRTLGARFEAAVRIGGAAA
ncbi:hypothetical protein [Actinocorallia sp. A-T 12471]|uniref:ATP-grasp domain-containing protein n=1 Tax=Actinocorallia sp. A-T 12471 TaxID=3089813 RepID=UPI0029CD0694|nr:hypothetical protein [Actinocorallia sp. A-T 12471]MDX6741640.1 hypothetical protein [Actinocorallia sp. A-T 12471]